MESSPAEGYKYRCFFSILLSCCCYFLITTTCYLFCLNKLPMVRDSLRAHPRYFEKKLLRSRTSMKCHVNDQLPVFHRRFIFCKNIESIFTEILSDSYRQSCIKGHTLKFILELFIELLNTFLSAWSSRMNAFGI